MCRRSSRPSGPGRMGGAFRPAAGRGAHPEDHPQLARPARGAGPAHQQAPHAGLRRRGLQRLLRSIPRKRRQVARVRPRRQRGEEGRLGAVALRRARLSLRQRRRHHAARSPGVGSTRPARRRYGIAGRPRHAGAAAGQAGAGGGVSGSRRQHRHGPEGGPRRAGPRRQTELAGAGRPLARDGDHRETASTKARTPRAISTPRFPTSTCSCRSRRPASSM